MPVYCCTLAHIILYNDANCFALAETHLGVVKRLKPDAEVVFGIIMGTGVGSGLVVNGKLINGLHGIAGEWGHNVLEPNGAPCYCGKNGCLETVISGEGLEAHYKNLTKQSLSLPEIVKQAAKADSYAQHTFSIVAIFQSIRVRIVCVSQRYLVHAA